MTGNQIPSTARQAVKRRDGGQCCRCYAPGAHHLHHRRRRADKTHYQHCACNLVTLCHVCHEWAHRHPALARDAGVIVPPYGPPPCDVPFTTPTGPVHFTCDGNELTTTPGWSTITTEGEPHDTTQP